jgi:hypothetical protein
MLIKLGSTGIPAIQFEETNGANNLRTLSAVAIFLSGVIIAALQISLPLRPAKLVEVVNSFWLFSLVFSIATAMNSFLALAWRQAI